MQAHRHGMPQECAMRRIVVVAVAHGLHGGGRRATALCVSALETLRWELAEVLAVVLRLAFKLVSAQVGYCLPQDECRNIHLSAR